MHAARATSFAAVDFRQNDPQAAVLSDARLWRFGFADSLQVQPMEADS